MDQFFSSMLFHPESGSNFMQLQQRFERIIENPLVKILAGVKKGSVVAPVFSVFHLLGYSL